MMRERKESTKEEEMTENTRRIRTRKTKVRNIVIFLKKKLITESKNNDEEAIYVSMKEDSDEDEKIALISFVNKSDRWIIDSGCSNHMTSYRSKF